MAPLTESGRFKHLLAQFRYDFADSTVNRDLLQRIAGGFDLVVEVRHKSWEDPVALGFLEGLNVGVCNLDYPTSTNSFNLQECKVGPGVQGWASGLSVLTWAQY